MTIKNKHLKAIIRPISRVGSIKINWVKFKDLKRTIISCDKKKSPLTQVLKTDVKEYQVTCNKVQKKLHLHN